VLSWEGEIGGGSEKGKVKSEAGSAAILGRQEVLSGGALGGAALRAVQLSRQDGGAPSFTHFRRDKEKIL